VTRAEAYLPTVPSSILPDPSSRLATIDIGRGYYTDACARKFRKWGGGCCAAFRGELMGLHITQCGCGRYLRTPLKFHLDPSNCLATIHQRYTDRTDIQDNGAITGRTVLQTVARNESLDETALYVADVTLTYTYNFTEEPLSNFKNITKQPKYQY